MVSLVGEGALFSSFPSIKVELEQIAEYCTNRAEYCTTCGAQELSHFIVRTLLRHSSVPQLVGRNRQRNPPFA